MRRAVAPVAAVAALLAAPAVAAGHAEISPESARGGTTTTFALHVADERDDASISRIAVRLPNGVAVARLPAGGGFRGRVQGNVVTWTGAGAEGELTVRMRLRLPASVGTLRFPVVQTYTGGDVDRWIGPAGSELPAPTVRVRTVAAGGDDDGGDDNGGGEDDSAGGGTTGGGTTAEPGTTGGGTTAEPGTTGDGATTDVTPVPNTTEAGGGVTAGSDDDGGPSTAVAVGIGVAAVALGAVAALAYLRRRA